MTSTSFFSIGLQPKRSSSVCEDVFDRVLQFDNNVNLTIHFSIYTDVFLLSIAFSPLSYQPTFERSNYVSDDIDLPNICSQTSGDSEAPKCQSYGVRFGCSSVADPLKSFISSGRKLPDGGPVKIPRVSRQSHIEEDEKEDGDDVEDVDFDDDEEFMAGIAMDSGEVNLLPRHSHT